MQEEKQDKWKHCHLTVPLTDLERVPSESQAMVTANSRPDSNEMGVGAGNGETFVCGGRKKGWMEGTSNPSPQL